MYADPCRRYRFGVTIENTDMRFWYVSRAGCMMSESFNFVTVSDEFLTNEVHPLARCSGKARSSTRCMALGGPNQDILTGLITRWCSCTLSPGITREC